ncbi:bile acid-CoA:amino acid N-acyltransferase-like [Crassostrea angulata]|uniref:bile acid-CoA:amino acid N-acyltransferase-like n=1 Tax=Magallana angulata TaxID=2784310 RepID=UPI0022B1EDA3|nr:bile acid-CoA:amino acid N-acyltransferase-like [Crassostrea angulata]
MTAVRIGADPIEALVDEKVWITVDGLSPNEPVTIKASLEEDNKKFSSYGCFTSMERGRVDLGTQPSLQGTYTGVDSMGILWSMGQ